MEFFVAHQKTSFSVEATPTLLHYMVEPCPLVGWQAFMCHITLFGSHTHLSIVALHTFSFAYGSDKTHYKQVHAIEAKEAKFCKFT